MASVFGTNRVPRYHNGTSAIALDYAVVLKDEPEPDIITAISPINGHRSTVVKGYRWVFEIRINLWKEGASANATLTQFLNDLGGTDHQIKRFGDAVDFMKNSSGNVYFTLVKVQPGFLTQARQYDTVILRWESNDYIDLLEDL